MMTAAQEKFANGLVAGHSQYKAYLAAYPAAKRWKRATVDKRASELAHKGEILGRLREARENSRKSATFDRAAKMEMLAKIAADNADGSPMVSIAAIKVLNDMTGDNAPQVIDNRVSVAASFDRERLMRIAKVREDAPGK